MGWLIPGTEKREPAPEYVAHVNAIGGMNRFGGPNFKLTWGQNETMPVWGVLASTGKTGRHLIPKHGNIPAWFIDVWKPPECYGTPELWYALTWDWEVDAPKIGEFPYQGCYELAPFNLFNRRFENGVMIIDAMPLNHYIIDLLIPNLLKEKDATFLQRKTAIQNRMLAERQRAAKTAMDLYLGAGPAFRGVAGTHESNHERWMQRVKEKQNGMRITRDQIVRSMGLGHKQQR